MLLEVWFCVNFKKNWRHRQKFWKIRPLNEHSGLIRPFKEQNPPFQEHFSPPDPPIKEHLVLKNPPLFHYHTRTSKYQVPSPGMLNKIPAALLANDGKLCACVCR